METRPIDPVMFQVKRDGVYLSSPRVKGRIRLHRSIARLLIDSSASINLDEVEGDSEAIARALKQLLELGFLEEAGGGESAWPTPWREWGGLAWQFHQSIRDAPFASKGTDERERYGDALAERDMPRGAKPIDPEVEILLLPRVHAEMPASFKDVLEDRRTHRDFIESPIPLESLSTLLHYTFAPLRFSDAGEMGVVQLRASAAGGARHETEAYVVALDVHGVSPGIYRYDNIRHGLISVQPGVSREQLEHLTHTQGFFTSAAFGVITTAVPERMAWKYPHPRAYKMLLQNVGHVAQVFSMTATALGLGAALTGAFRDSEVESLLSIDGVGEFPTFFFSCGVPQRNPDGSPIRYRSPESPFLN
ncbi:SagB/ThcOx family dehydrogenase [Streptomyces sp. CBG31]|uniref:SagB/ThcOx family dehydrogenase n=1 Tax=Streptomyces sp. CBG31 TaxID=2762623 RepID=UPI001EFD14C7|nr:SagB/ThcOx family dehydrogenase [Streptomyces sp. CBG31]